MPSVRILGRGRAGGALAGALGAVAGWEVELVEGRGPSVASAAAGVDALVLAVPDAAIASVAASITPAADTVVLHLAGSLGLDVLASHQRRAALHPLVALPNAGVGAQRLRGASFAVAGDGLAAAIVDALGGQSFEVGDGQRAAYHAAACIASNHLVALLAQAERVAASARVPLRVYLDLVRATVDNVADLGPAAAITGPAARGDDETIARHLNVLGDDDRPLYALLAEECRRLAALGQR
jgi:predicted short-subunit dehydrogenase-like oxidoreductase (DUF2520 family)